MLSSSKGRIAPKGKTMTKQLTNSTAYLAYGYIVTLTHIRNDANGNPRFQADIAHLGDLNARHQSSVARYTFTGHYASDAEAAMRILAHHLKEEVE